MQGTIVTNIANNVMVLLGKFANKTGKEKHFIKRSDKTKITPTTFSKVMILGCLSSVSATLSEFCQLFKQEGIKVSKQAVHERFNTSAANLMEALFKESLRQFQSEQKDVFEILKPFSSVQLLDSSTIALPSSMQKLYRGCGGSGPDAALKLQTFFNYKNGQVKDFIFTEGRKNDQSFTDHLTSIEKNALYLQDLGYFCTAAFAKIHAQNAYFLSRLFGQTAIYDVAGVRIELQERLKKAENFLVLDVLLGRDHKVPVRLIAQRLSDAAISKRLRKIYEEARRSGETPTQNTLKLAQWSICITNIPKTLLKDMQVYKLYAVRWQIELFFKLCKQEAGINKIKSKKSSRILCEIYARLIGVVMLLYICWPVRLVNEGKYELSFSKAYEYLRKRVLLFFKALNTLHRLSIFLQELLSDLQSFAMKDIKRKNPATYQIVMELGSKKRDAIKQKGLNNAVMGNVYEHKLAA